MTAADLDTAATAVLEDAIAAGRLPAVPRPEVLARIAAVIRPTLAMKRTATAGMAGAVHREAGGVSNPAP